MLILGISTSSKYPSAAVMRGEELLSFMEDTSGRSHSETLLGLVESALSEAGIDKCELDRIAVDIGPGSFTGVRIGVSCANAMAYALGVKVIPVSSLRAIAEAGFESDLVAPMIDCRNGNCYAALYCRGEEMIAPKPAVISEFIASLPDGCVKAGDCFPERNDKPDAKLVLKAALKLADSAANEAVPMYLRPSQAERMRGR